MTVHNDQDLLNLFRDWYVARGDTTSAEEIDIKEQFYNFFSTVLAANQSFYGTTAGTLAATSTDALTTKVTGDAATRFVLNADGKQEWGDGTSAVDTNLYRNAANVLKTDDAFSCAGLTSSAATGLTGDVTVTTGEVILATAGKGFQIKTSGGASKAGVATLSGNPAVATVSTTAVTANSLIFLTHNSSGSGTPAFVRVSTRTPGTSFVITSTSTDNTGTVAWMIVEPSA